MLNTHSYFPADPAVTVFCFPVCDRIGENCYIWLDSVTLHGFLIDPGAGGAELAAFCRRHGWVIEKILLTHAHFDHIGGIADFLSACPVPVCIHQAGLAALTDPYLNLSRMVLKEITFSGAVPFSDGDVFSLEANPAQSLRVIHTPGHTPESVLFHDGLHDLAFTGDTIFQGTRGNDTFPGGDGALLLRSIRQRVLALPDATVLFSGHTPPTTVRDERPLYTEA